jgi:hypothetical protein
VNDGAATLTGDGSWQYERDAAARALRYGRGIRTVVNAIAIRPEAVAIGATDAIGAALVRNALSSKASTSP